MNNLSSIGFWRATTLPPAFLASQTLSLLSRIREPVYVLRDPASGRVGIAVDGQLSTAYSEQTPGLPVLAVLPALYPEWLGNRLFCEVHRVRFPYIAGEMANGIASARMVLAIAEAGMLGFFGAAGLSPRVIEGAIDELEGRLGDRYPWGVNLIHSPNEGDYEDHVVDLLIRRGVQRVSASAFMALTPAVVRYSASGLTTDAKGRVVRKHHVFAKLSRPEVALHFMSPAPAAMLQALVEKGKLTAEEARLAGQVAIAEDITVEADSGGHTDNQTLTALFPTILALRDELTTKYGFRRPIRVGAAGGLGTPGALAAAFSLGAAYVLTGSVNQSAVEAGMSDAGKQMLANADIADVMMAPSADMFELGVKVQVLKRGTMFGVRAQKLYDTYVQYPSIEAIPAELRARLEKDLFKAPLDQIWTETREFWQQRDPEEVARAERDPKHRMALCFRWYLGRSSRWAIAGDPARRLDYQLWCGPAMGSFNRWVAGTFLAEPANRSVVQIALNLMEGAAIITRAQQLRSYGVAVPDAAFDFRPRPLA